MLAVDQSSLYPYFKFVSLCDSILIWGTQPKWVTLIYEYGFNAPFGCLFHFQNLFVCFFFFLGYVNL